MIEEMLGKNPTRLGCDVGIFPDLIVFYPELKVAVWLM
jgi:hypothetical protein